MDLALSSVALLGLVAGFVATLAGGAAALTLPLMIAMGVPPHIVEGATHGMLLVSGVTRLAVFQRAHMVDWTRMRSLLVVSALGAALGTVAESFIPEDVLEAAALPSSAAALVLVVSGFRRFRDHSGALSNERPATTSVAVFAAIGFWAGVSAAGVGYFFLWALVLLAGYDTRHAAAQKSALILAVAAVSTIGAVGVGELDVPITSALSAGGLLGSWVGARFVAWPGSGRWIYRSIVAMALAEVAWLTFIIFS